MAKVNSQIRELRINFKQLNIMQKKKFIDDLKIKLKDSKNKEYKIFLNDCIKEYNLEVRESISDNVSDKVSNNVFDKKNDEKPIESTNKPIKIISLLLIIFILILTSVYWFRNLLNKDEIFIYESIIDSQHFFTNSSSVRVTRVGEETFNVNINKGRPIEAQGLNGFGGVVKEYFFIYTEDSSIYAEDPRIGEIKKGKMVMFNKNPLVDLSIHDLGVDFIDDVDINIDKINKHLERYWKKRGFN